MVFVYLCFREARSSLLGTDASDRSDLSRCQWCLNHWVVIRGVNQSSTNFCLFPIFLRHPKIWVLGIPFFWKPPNSRGILLGLDGAKRPKPFQRLWRTHVEIHAPLPDFCGRYRSVLLWEWVETLRGLIQIDLSHLISGIRKPEKVPTHPRILHLMSIDLLKCCDVWSIGTSRVGEVQEFAIVSLLIGSSLAQDQVKATPLQLLSQWFDSTIGQSCDQQLPICTVDSVDSTKLGFNWTVFQATFFQTGSGALSSSSLCSEPAISVGWLISLTLCEFQGEDKATEPRLQNLQKDSGETWNFFVQMLVPTNQPYQPATAQAHRSKSWAGACYIKSSSWPDTLQRGNSSCWDP